MEPDRVLNGFKILELANKAYFLYLKQTPEEKAKLLKMVLSNCSWMLQVSIPHTESPST